MQPHSRVTQCFSTIQAVSTWLRRHSLYSFSAYESTQLHFYCNPMLFHDPSGFNLVLEVAADGEGILCGKPGFNRMNSSEIVSSFVGQLLSGAVDDQQFGGRQLHVERKWALGLQVACYLYWGFRCQFGISVHFILDCDSLDSNIRLMAGKMVEDRC